MDDRPAPIHDTRRLGRCATPCKFDHAHDHLPESGEEDEQCGKSGEGQSQQRIAETMCETEYHRPFRYQHARTFGLALLSPPSGIRRDFATQRHQCQHDGYEQQQYHRDVQNHTIYGADASCFQSARQTD